MNRFKLFKFTSTFAFILVVAAMLCGCGQSNEAESENRKTNSVTAVSSVDADMVSDSTAVNSELSSELEVRFGDNGEPFLMHLKDNETAKTIAGYVGTSDWRLPIYENDSDADYEIMQYYDIPSSYKIPPNSEHITSVKAGEVYYSDPNRIVLFYQDAEISGEYTLIGSFDVTDEFVAAVEKNPVLEGWSNKIIQISQP